MKRVTSLVFCLMLALGFVMPALAGEGHEGNVRLTGWIADEWCGAKNANAEGAACARACAKKGSAMVLVADGKTYKLSDKEKALEHVGHEVVVTGTLTESGTIEVRSIEKAEKKA